MPRPRSGPRATGPYYCAARKKYRIFIYQGQSPKPEILWFSTEHEARQALRQAAQQLAEQIPRRLADLVEEYLADKERQGLANAASCAHQRPNFVRFFAGHLEHDIHRLTPRDAAQLYDCAVRNPSKRTGKPAAAATHRHYLDLARALFSWAVRKGYVAQNPFKDVRPVGRPSTGKPQLRLDEATRYLEVAFRRFDEKQDRMALAAVVPLYLGLRPGEVLMRRVRDVDSGGSVLWIDKGKSKNARRHLIIKAQPLRQRLARLVAGRPPEEPLFCVDDRKQPPCLHTLRRAVLRICEAARVPKICPHSLRGLWATLSVESGAAESAVAAALGHGSFEMTARHYAQPEARAAARSARVLTLLDRSASEDLDEMTAEQLAARISPDVLAGLLAIAHHQRPARRQNK